MNEHQRLCITCPLHFVKYITIFPVIATLFTSQYRIEFACCGLYHFVGNRQRPEGSAREQACLKYRLHKCHITQPPSRIQKSSIVGENIFRRTENDLSKRY